ncbi:acetyl-CoA carboxylase, biotin carboxyl carrier protein [Amycolatopsis sp. K13G38]|uniref:Biotin carboxyl carrier protein of acetyl-CoA carboxylase n=1 Tax=Amycolatopsis acididurans TaxID=2724524 RepID=A0ABX1IXS1_9PSEU|nr:biotin/lipoyl-containing protein [Amycolatopsis acididurans]NKQ52305.1 acetyl-CoA carboxylase, biotin carboxyl carrier protein [Amycolatopsis acididurans]
MNELSFSEVGEIVGLIGRLDCDTFELEHGDLKISLRRDGAEPAVSPPPPVAEAPPPAPESAVTEAPAADDTSGSWVAVTAPMVGTFYRRRSPEEPPLAEIGDRVEAGQAVGLIEVMKLFTELTADSAGTVVRVDADDATLVEYGQALVWLDPGAGAEAGQ